jgi:multidrug efflux system membrane fusion protein
MKPEPPSRTAAAPAPAAVAPTVAALAAVVLVTVVFAGSCSRRATHSEAAPPVPVTTAVAVQRDVPVEVRAIGTVQAHSTVEVRAQVGGVLEKVHFVEGQDVRPGDRLFSLDARPYDAALKSARAALARDRALQESAARDVARYADLVRKEYVTQEEFDRIRTNAASLEASVRADEAALENAQVALEYCTIRSPIDGRTGQLNVHAGNLVKANADAPMVVINQVRPIDVAFSVPEQNLAAIRAGREKGALEVRARIPESGDDPITGELSFVDNTVDHATGTLRLKASFANTAGVLWPGQYVEVVLRLSVRPAAILVPSQAVQVGQKGSFVFVVRQDDTVESRPVSTGPAVGAETVIETGLAAGDRVVTDGQLRLVDTTKVVVKPSGGAGTPP